MKLLLLIFVLCFAQISCARNNSGMIFHRPPIASVPPTVVSISPTSGTTLGGTSVTITGTGIKAGATATIGGVTCTSPSVSPTTSMTCTTGAHAAGAVSATVTNLDLLFGTGGTFTYVTPPPVANITCYHFNSFLSIWACVPVNGTAVMYKNLNGSGFLSDSKVNLNCPGSPWGTTLLLPNGGGNINMGVYSLFEFRQSGPGGAMISMYTVSTYTVGWNGSALTKSSNGAAISGACTVL